jgi:DUF4097 and DUF4098 domain-containing protein YvlB
MKRIIVVVLLIAIAGIAGIVRSHSKNGHFSTFVSHKSGGDQSREEIRQSYQLEPGAMVEVAGINGFVKIETSETKSAEVYIERTGESKEALERRKITIEANANSLSIRGDKGDSGFFDKLFGSSPAEEVTLKLPRQISLQTKGINGPVTVGDLDGSVDVKGVNGRVQIAGAKGPVTFKGINGNITVGLKEVSGDGVTLGGVNGNIDLQLPLGLNADFQATGINGNVASSLPDVSIEKDKRGKYSGRIGNGGSQGITAKGINGNIRLTRSSLASAAPTAEN